MQRLTRVQSYWAGLATYWSFAMLRQDWLGLDGFVDYARTHWIVLPWQPWLVGVVLGLAMLHFAREADSEETE